MKWLTLLSLFSVFALHFASAAPEARNGRPCKEFDLTITWETHAPDGFSRKMLLVNGQSPGPVLDLDQDDWVIVRVHNESPYNTTVHFHGMEMHKTPWSDGVPGVTQRPIKPGQSFTHEFEATQYGTYWYHSHFRAHIEDGLYGPVVVRPHKDQPTPFHMITKDESVIESMKKADREAQPLVIADFSHLTSTEKWDMTLDAGLEDSCYDSILMNGKGRVSCLDADKVADNLSDVQKTYLAGGASMTDKSCIPAKIIGSLGGGSINESAIPDGVFEGCKATKGSVEVIHAKAPKCKTDKWIAIHIVSSINFITALFSIDEHDMFVYSMDGAYIEPQKVQAIPLSNGDRYSVLVKLSKAGDYKIRVNANSAPQIIDGHAILSVEGEGSHDKESNPYITIAGAPVSDDVVQFDQNTAYPYPPEPIAQKADQFNFLTMNLDGASYLWELNSSRLMPGDIDNDLPTLFHPDPYVSNNVTISTRNNTWVDLLFFAASFPMPPHPIHKHGNRMYQIGSGTGKFNYSSTEEAVKHIPEQFNLKNPPRRDAFNSLPTADDVSWVVVRYHVTNPGAWLLHCHIANHMNGGMMMVIQDGVDEWPDVPDKYLDYEV